MDPDVFPFLSLHAEINGAEIATMRRKLGGIKEDDLNSVDVSMRADICFRNSLLVSMKRLVVRAMRTGVKLVIIADPGRSTFEEPVDYLPGR